jgi:hypothetical protein
MTSYFPVNFSYKRKLGNIFWIFPEVLNEFSFSRLIEGGVVYFGYGRVIGRSFEADFKKHIYLPVYFLSKLSFCL